MKKRLKKIIVALVIFAIAMVLNILNLSYTKFAFNINNSVQIINAHCRKRPSLTENGT